MFFDLVVALAVRTGAGTIASWYYGVTLIFSLLGGILVLAFPLAPNDRRSWPNPDQ